MPPMKIQPIDIDPERERVKEAVVAKPVLKSRLRRLFVFDRQLAKPVEAPPHSNKDAEFEPSSVCLAKMVQNFMEETNEKPPKCSRNRCNCFNTNTDDEEFDLFGGSFAESTTDAIDSLKSLIPCASVGERNLLADTAKVVEKNVKVYKQKDDLTEIVADGLSSLGYDSSICISKWDKTSSSPAGEYKFIDAIVEGERMIIDIDFRSEFEIARSTATYKAILQSLPFIFVGKSERLKQIVSIVSEAARQSLRKKGMHVPPWRKAEYMLAKWLSSSVQVAVAAVPESLPSKTECNCGELELIFGENPAAWKPPALKPKNEEKAATVVTGLASLLKDKS